MKKKSHKKHLGQNFLTDLSVVDQIVDVSTVTAEDTVIEVGPGEGVLTKALAATGAQIYAVEYDIDLIPYLKERFKPYPNVEVVHADVRTLYIAQFCKEKEIESYRVVANVPYYITSMIIRLFLESAHQPLSMTIMVQKEVAQRICAHPGEMSKLALSVQYFGTPHYIREVSRHAFDPVPEVDSAVIHVADIARRESVEKESAFFRVVRAGFSAKRKKLVSNISNSLHIDRDRVTQMLEGCDLQSNTRAQELSMEQWQFLAGQDEILRQKENPGTDNAK